MCAPKFSNVPCLPDNMEIPNVRERPDTTEFRRCPVLVRFHVLPGLLGTPEIF